MSTFVSILLAFVVLSFFVVVHELGHYGVGRLLGFGIVEFAVGMGPVVFKVKRKGIDYALRALPIGGMCRFYGEDEDLPAGTAAGIPFNAQKVWKRFLVVLAGPVMNFIFAIIFAIVALVAYGDYLPQIQEFSFENSPAEEAGLLPGDILVNVDGHEIMYYTQATDFIVGANSEQSPVTVLRNGERVTVTVHDFYSQADGRNMLGIQIDYARVHFGFFEACGRSFGYVWSMLIEMVKFLGTVFQGTVQSGDVVGPVGTITTIAQAVRLGFETALRLAVLISVNLGFINILPFPALDGGRLSFMLVEMVRGKPVAPQREGVVHFVGFVLLMALMAYLVVKDVSGLFGG